MPRLFRNIILNSSTTLNRLFAHLKGPSKHSGPPMLLIDYGVLTGSHRVEFIRSCNSRREGEILGLRRGGHMRAEI
ncbi:hypothetical protein WAI453_005531 [Rhynchosporium graminicola]